MKKIIKHIRNIIRSLIKRKHFSRYTFFDVNNVPSWALAYLLVFFRGWNKIYENKMTQYFKAPAFNVGSGRMGLYLLLKLFGVNPGDEVLLTGYTCVVCPNAIVYVGARPIYVDIDPDTYGLDPNKIEEKITSKTRALIIQHTYGIPSRLEEIINLAKKHDLVVIEDCAHALGGQYNGKRLGTFGDAAFFSSDHTKMISTSVGGGMILNNPKYLEKTKRIMAGIPSLTLFQRVRIFLQYLFNGLMSKPRLNWFGYYLMQLYARLGFSFYFLDENIIKKDNISKYPYPVRMSNFQAYIGSREFDRLEDNLQHRSNVVRQLEEIFGVSYNGQPLLMFPLLTKDPLKWKNIFDPYIELYDWFSKVVYGKNADLSEINYTEGDCPIGEKTGKHVIAFPTNFYINSFAIKLIRQLYEKHSLKNEILNKEVVFQ